MVGAATLFLAIETSCDETGVAVVCKEGGGGKIAVRSNLLFSQVPLHALYGGVVPELAAREHAARLPALLKSALAAAGCSGRDIEAVAVTRGPGLKGCLLIGHTFAKGYAMQLGKPIYGVNHLEGHLAAVAIDTEARVEPPFLGLVVSGGHTMLVEVAAWGRYSTLATTLDDAAGEAFDKSAHLLGFPYPGGAQLSQAAQKFRHSGAECPYVLPRVKPGTAGFSFSGLKTAVSLLISRESVALASEEGRSALAYAIEEAIVEAVFDRTAAAVRDTGSFTLVVVGGVAANRRLRERLRSLEVKVVFPTPEYCTDNAAMIGAAAALLAPSRQPSSLTESVLPRWPLDLLGRSAV